MLFRLVQVLALVSISVCTVPLARRQMPEGLSCSTIELTDKLATFPQNPSLCSSAATNFAAIPADQYLERQDDVLAALRQICSEECLPHVVGLVDLCYPAFREPLGIACASNSQIQCWQGPAVNNGTGVLGSCAPVLQGQRCEESCQQAITDIRRDLGCCVNNIFNTTVFSLEELQVASPQLWEACGVAQVPFCPVPEIFDTVVETTTAVATTAASAPRQLGSVALVMLIIWVSSLFY